MIAEIGAAFTGLKMTATALKTANDLHNQVEIDLRSSELLEKIGNFGMMIISLQEYCSKLEKEKSKFEKIVLDNKEWKKETARYELYEIDTGMFVYAYKKSDKNKDPMHYLCAKCMNDGKKSILNFRHECEDGSKVYHCPSCDKLLTTHIKRHIPIEPLSRHRSRDWLSQY